MNNQERQHFRELLENKRSALLELAKAGENQANELSPSQTGELSNKPSHPADLATNARLSEVQNRLSEMQLTQLREIDEAIERLERGDYGKCFECGESIDRQRLEAMPETRYCIECEQDMEMAKQLSTEPRTASVAKADLANLLVSDIMTPRPISVRRNEGVDAAVDLMFRHNIRHLPVVDQVGNLQGIVSNRDLLRVSPAEKNPIDRFMTKIPETVSPDSTVVEAGTMLLDNGFSSLPVVEGNRLVGIVTEADFVRIVTHSLQS